MSYITVDELRSYTGITSTQMDDTSMQEHIDAAEEYIHRVTGTIFTTTTVTETYDSTSYNQIITNYLPITNVSKVEYSFDEGSSYTELSSDYYKYNDWSITIKKKSPVYNISANQIDFWRITYTYGHTSVPKVIKEAMYELAGMYAMGFMFDKNSTADSIKLGDATIYKKDYQTKKQKILQSVLDKLAKYTYKEFMIVGE